MKIMVVAAEWPKPDQASGHFRFFQLLSYLAPIHEILFCALDRSGSPHPRSEDDKRLTAIGIECGTQGFQRALRHFRPQIVWFEFFHQVRPDYVPFIRYLLPEARIIIDSVDVHFNRLEAKARLTQLPNDAREANEMRRKELAAYRQADIVVAVSQADAKILSDSLPQGIDVKVVPNVHPSQTFRSRTSRNFGELIFVGGFRHTPNVDGISFFINDILPLIRLKNPSVRVKVIGSNMPDAVRALAGEGIEIIGFVPETAPYLQSAYISIAPLRFGGGMKGKVGEAMSFGLPVVTTSFGAEGFGIDPNRDLLVADTAQGFADHIESLLKDDGLYERVARSGYDFISAHFAEAQVEAALRECLGKAMEKRPQRRSIAKSIRFAVDNFYAKNIAWRIGRS